MYESREWTFTFTKELPCIASIYFTYTLKIYMRTQAKILLPRSCKNKTTCPKETTVNLSIFAAFHTTYLKSGRPFTFNDYDPEERNSKVALWGLLYHTPRYACAQAFHLGSEKWKRPAVNVCCVLVFTTRLPKNAFSLNITSFSGITFSSSINFSKNLLSQLGPSQSPSHRHL